MPRPRFNKLSAEKQERIMEAAAKEFSAYGFEQASLNRILEAAGISKGAAYYYFDDKADVFMTVVQYYSQEVRFNIDIDIDQLTAQTFWPTLTQVYQQQLIYAFNHPGGIGVLTALSKVSSETLEAYEVLAAFAQEITAWLTTFLKKGQAVGVIRGDLPDDLMVKLFLAIDAAHDEWLLAHQDQLTPEKIEQDIMPRLIDLLHRVLDPSSEYEG
jgi:AcrR family transcriptional regulator